VTRTNDLRNLILKAKHAYYYSGEPIMSDAEYDALEDELRKLAPDDPVLAIVGAPVPPDSMLTKARHSIPMGSQSKVNSEDEFRNWCAKTEINQIHASLKGDGASAAAYYTDGRLMQAISRGDGTVGEDITANALCFKGLPAWAGTELKGFTGAVRFEVILTVDDWTRIDPSRSKNPRNAGAGIMGRKNGYQSDHLTIFAFDLDETRDGRSVTFQTETQKAARLAELGFNVIPHQPCADAHEAVAYFQEIARTRDLLPFWIDGVVMKIDDIAKQTALGITSGRPKGQMAWKFDSVGVETILEGVVVSGGHTGGLYPTAQLRPVEIGGTTVSNASLANYDEIARLDVAIGDSVWVVKANDIIPKIIRATHRPASRTTILVPTECPFCGGQVGRRQTSDGGDGVIVECRNGECPIKSSGKIRRWIASLDIQGIGDAVREAMIERFDLEDAADLYALSNRATELAGLVINTEKDLTLGEKRASSILDAIDATRTLKLSEFLGSLGIDHLGKRRVELMIKAAQGELDTLDDWRSGRLRAPALAEKAGVPNVSVQIQDAIDRMERVIDKLLTNGVTILPPEQDIPSDDGGPHMTVCISGKLPSGKKKSDYVEPLRAVGYELVDDVAKGLDYLVLADPASTSSKAEKARKLEIEVISEERLEEIVSGAGTGHAQQTLQARVQQSLTATKLEEAAMKPTKSATMDEGDVQYFEYVDDKSSKFWEVRVDGTSVNVRYGRIGTAGQTITKDFDDPAAARKHADKLVAEKLKGGYQRVGGKSDAPKDTIAVISSTSPVKAAKPVASVTEKSKAATPDGQKTVCISGKLPSGKKKADYSAALAAAGYELLDDVKVGLSYLVLADPQAAGAKADKAKKLGIPIISEEELIGLCAVAVSAAEAKPTANSVQTDNIVKIERGSKVEKHNTEMLKLRNEVLGYLASHKKLSSDGFSKDSSTAANLKKAFAFFEESFALERKLLGFEKADRCASMLCGPFFTSAKHPQPERNGQLLIPFVQLDLDWINRSCGKNLPSGLLQVWYSPSGNPEIRVIAPQDFSNNLLTDFSTDDSMLTEAATMIPADWGFPHSDSFSQITSLVSIGITSPNLTSLCNCDYEDHEELMDLVEAIEDAQYGVRTSKKNVVPDAHLFGRFAPYQTSVTDYANYALIFDVYGICGAGVANLLLHESGRWELVVGYR
jgi:DNA ligase (NAD+)